MSEADDEMLAIRDRLQAHLKSNRIPGNVGLTRMGGVPEHLLVITPGADGVPTVFEGVQVSIRVVGKAVAQTA